VLPAIPLGLGIPTVTPSNLRFMQIHILNAILLRGGKSVRKRGKLTYVQQLWGQVDENKINLQDLEDD
jgi:hypothetical protein